MTDKPIGMRINEVGQLFRTSVKELAQERGVSSTYFSVCNFLNRNKDVKVTQKDICEFTNMKAPTISLTLQSMENEGLIERLKSETDSRCIYVTLTNKGLELALEVKKCFLKMDDVLINALTKEELEEFYKTLEKLKNAMGK